jgi:hypothetical protein
VKPGLQHAQHLWQPHDLQDGPPASGTFIKWREKVMAKGKPFEVAGERVIVGEIVDGHRTTDRREHVIAVRAVAAMGVDAPRKGRVERRPWSRLRRIDAGLAVWPAD